MASSSVPAITVNGLPLPTEHCLSAPTDSGSLSSALPTQNSQPSPLTTSRSHNTRKGQAFDFTHETHEYNNIVYNYQGYGVLVKAAPTYKEAIDTAIEEFPRLATVPREDITISYHTASDGKMTHWRISSSAWPSSAKGFGPRTKLVIAVRGEDDIAGPASHGLPKAHSQPSMKGEYKPPPPYEPHAEIMARRQRARSTSPGGVRTPTIVTSRSKNGRGSNSFTSFFRRL